MGKTNAISGSSPWNIHAEKAYKRWREDKLANVADLQPIGIQIIENIANISESERTRLIETCDKCNFAIYGFDQASLDQISLRKGLLQFANSLGLKIAEKHRSAEGDGIVSIRVTSQQRQRGYVPYSRKAMNWHTDGYYNQYQEQIQAMVLHCVQPAHDGGYNQLLDPELAYIHLRDANPAYVSALMHLEAMTIPENQEADGSIRPVSTGPVFLIAATGKLAMRYTARTRSIEWRNDSVTREAVAVLKEFLESGTPSIHSVKLAAGQGVICNNALHNRSMFADNDSQDSTRLVYRMRFFNRVGDT